MYLQRLDLSGTRWRARNEVSALKPPSLNSELLWQGNPNCADTCGRLEPRSVVEVMPILVNLYS